MHHWPFSVPSFPGSTFPTTECISGPSLCLVFLGFTFPESSFSWPNRSYHILHHWPFDVPSFSGFTLSYHRMHHWPFSVPSFPGPNLPFHEAPKLSRNFNEFNFGINLFKAWKKILNATQAPDVTGLYLSLFGCRLSLFLCPDPFISLRIKSDFFYLPPNVTVIPSSLSPDLTFYLILEENLEGGSRARLSETQWRRIYFERRKFGSGGRQLGRGKGVVWLRWKWAVV